MTSCEVKCLISRGLVYCYINRFSGISKVRNSGFNSVAVLQRI